MGEVNVKSFGLLITGRCNYGCTFCAVDGLAKVDMAFSDFKRLIQEIKEFSHNSSFPFTVCIAGGEPFLHPKAVEMISYTVKELGRTNVSVTTNLSLFPTNKSEAIRLLKKMGLPQINISIDREHARFGKAMPERIKAACSAAKKLGVKIGVIAVAQNSHQVKRPWQPAIAKVIPRKLQDHADLRLEQYSSKKAESLRLFLKNLGTGKKGAGILHSKMPHVSYHDFLPDMVTVHFSPDGRTVARSDVLAFNIPQLSIGNWKREPLHDIVNKNLPFKYKMLKPWIGVPVLSGKNSSGLYLTEKLNPKKSRLLAKAVLRRFKEQRKRRKIA